MKRLLSILSHFVRVLQQYKIEIWINISFDMVKGHEDDYRQTSNIDAP